MAGTYVKLYIQVVFSVKFREKQIQPEWKEILNRYISGIIKAKGNTPYIVNGTSDHIHILMSIRPTISISDLVRDIKNNSSNFINEKKLPKKKFSWQEGYGAFSYAPSAISNVYNYILNQEAHHNNQTFESEYVHLLASNEIEFDEAYVFG